MGRPPSFKGEDTYLGRGVSYCATCDGAFYRDSEVAVVGVNQEAIEEAQFLTKFAKTVHWITQADPKVVRWVRIAVCRGPRSSPPPRMVGRYGPLRQSMHARLFDGGCDLCAQADDEHALALLECPQVKHWSQTRMLSIEGDASGVTGVHLKPRGEEEACCRCTSGGARAGQI